MTPDPVITEAELAQVHDRHPDLPAGSDPLPLDEVDR